MIYRLVDGSQASTCMQKNSIYVCSPCLCIEGRVAEIEGAARRRVRASYKNTAGEKNVRAAVIEFAKNHKNLC